MPQSCVYNCGDMPDHERIACGLFLKGGINSIGVLECDHTITDFEDQTQLQNAIDDGSLKLIEQVRGNLPEAAEVVGVNPNACGSQDVLDGFDWTMGWTDFNVSAVNDGVYEALNVRQSYLIWYECENDLLRVVETPVSFVAKLVQPESNKEKQTYIIQAKWSSNPDEFPDSFAAPAGIFNQD